MTALVNRERAEAVMDELGLAAIVASTIENVYYLSDWSTSGSWGFRDLTLAILPRDRTLAPAVITAGANAGMAQQRGGTWMPFVRAFGAGNPYSSRDAAGTQAGKNASPVVFAGPDQLAALRACLGELGLLDRPIGFDDVTIGDALARDGGLDGFRAVPAIDVFRRIRMVKTEEEVSLVRRAANKTAIAVESMVEALASGATCREAERVFWSVLPMLGGQAMFLLITGFRTDEGRLAAPETLVRGDMVTFDATASVGHYFSDLGRTAYFGQPRRDQLQTYDAIRRGWEVVLPKIRAGVAASEVQASLVAAVRGAGAPTFNSGTLHCVGLEHTDNPHQWYRRAPFTLETGMVVSVDMPYQDLGIGKFHMEELILVTDGGVELLSDGDNRLYVIDRGEVARAD